MKDNGRPTGGKAHRMYVNLPCQHNEKCFGIMRKLRTRLDYYNNHEEMLAKGRQWKADNIEQHRASNRAYARRNKNRNSILGQLYYQNVSKPRMQKKHQEARMECLRYYSDGKLVCAYCGFDRIEALQLDHLNGDGAKVKNKFGKRPPNRFIVIARDKPEGYQVLCANCNFVKGNMTDTDFRTKRADWFR